MSPLLSHILLALSSHQNSLVTADCGHGKSVLGKSHFNYFQRILNLHLPIHFCFH